MEGQNREGTQGRSERGQGVENEKPRKKEQKIEETKHKTLMEESEDETKQDGGRTNRKKINTGNSRGGTVV